jgi:hypothetical protein
MSFASLIIFSKLRKELAVLSLSTGDQSTQDRKSFKYDKERGSWRGDKIYFGVIFIFYLEAGKMPTTKWSAMSASSINPEVPLRDEKTLSMQEELV